MTPEKRKRGGAQPGAGRPKTPKETHLVRTVLAVRPDQIEPLALLGRGKWLRAKIDEEIDMRKKVAAFRRRLAQQKPNSSDKGK
ncbi:MAG: hypothetical protein ACRCWJ_11670 [Casimicrobium sp.]